jgi:TetR/AcrR family transcriptional regulator
MAGKKKKNDSGVDSRKQLLEVALRLFAQKGYAATSIREIVEAAGTTAPSLYYYFGSKEGLYIELMQTQFAQLDSLLEPHLNKAESAKSRLQKLIDQIFLHVIEDQDFFRLMYTIYYGPPQGAPFFDITYFHVRFHGYIRKIVEEGIKSKEFLPVNPGSIAWIIRGTVQLAIEDQIKYDTVRIDREGLQRILDLILGRFLSPLKSTRTR